jgi:Ca2+-binding RTX toxin-like protein
MQPTRIVCLLLGALLAALAAAPAATAKPACGEAPEIAGNTIYGTPCPDFIPPPPRSVTVVNGEGGDDVVFGGRGNDQLNGGDGGDWLYGGIGDDRLRGNGGSDRLSGGFGGDSLDGQDGDDFARGDATVDRLDDSGGGTDTLSFATGATPGFPNTGSFFTDAGFPAGAEGRGVFVDLGDDFANNGQAPSGGGVDEPLKPATDLGNFETVIGTPFPDYIVGTSDFETFYGGGGGDLIDGGGGGDVARGGADGDGCVDVAVEDCESSNEEIDLRDPATISVGSMAPQAGGAAGLYLTGSDQDDVVTATLTDDSVTFTLGLGSEAAFDASPGAAGGCDPPASGQVVCPVNAAPDSIVLAGMDGDDTLSASGFPATVSVVLLGGGDDDELTGGDTEDALVDGAGDDVSHAGSGDDAVPNNAGGDDLLAGPGDDLFVSNAVCNGDSLDGGPGRDNANWANFTQAVTIDMGAKAAGEVGPAGQAQCDEEELLTDLVALEDIEGTSDADVLVGDGADNQLLGRLGSDSYFAAAGNDSILANSGEDFADPDPTIDCGDGGEDVAQIDFPGNGPDAAPTACEDVEEREPNSFRPPNTPTNPNPEPPVIDDGFSNPPPPPRRPLRPVRDRTPPNTRLLHRPAGPLFASAQRRQVAFAFAADERGASFRCKLDRRPFRLCRSPRRYLLGAGTHSFRAVAIDRAGNRDRSPVLVNFRIRRR